MKPETKQERSKTYEFLVYGPRALFTDPTTKTSGERHSYSVPTYEAIKGIVKSCFWKPTIEWVIDEIRVMRPIRKQPVGTLLPSYSGGPGDRVITVYLDQPAYQVACHFEWSGLFPEDENLAKYENMMRKALKVGGRMNVFLGSAECGAYIEEQAFGSGAGAYDGTGDLDLGIMFHGWNYPKAGSPNQNMLEARLWDCHMVDGIIEFVRPEECQMVRQVRKMAPNTFENNRITQDEIEGKDGAQNGEQNLEAIGELVFEMPTEKPQVELTSWANKLINTFDKLQAHDEQCTCLEEMSGMEHMGWSDRVATCEFSIDPDGNFIKGSARVLTAEEGKTPMPNTIESQTRTSGGGPCLLFDHLVFLAADAAKYTDSKKCRFNEYIANLRKWCESEYSDPIVEIIRTYLEKGTLCADLENEGILPIVNIAGLGKTVMSRKEWEELGKAPMPIHEVIADKKKNPLETFVRIKIEGIEGLNPEVWNVPQLWKDSYNFAKSLGKEDTGLCYITGKEEQVLVHKHPYVGGTLKLLSSNDTKGYTFRRGETKSPDDLFQCSYEASQKIHIALRWLWKHRSFVVGEKDMMRRYIIWSENDLELPELNVYEQKFNGFTTNDEDTEDQAPELSYRERVRAFAIGQNHASVDQGDLEKDNTYVLEIASTAPGRICITNAMTFTTSDFMARINHWYATTYDTLKVWDESGKKSHYELRPMRTLEMREVICGGDNSKAYQYQVLQKLIRCVFYGESIPRPYVESAMRTAYKSILKMDASDRWFGITRQEKFRMACGVVRKYLNDQHNQKRKLEDYEEVWGMALDVTCADRSYLLGRLLAYEHEVERKALILQSKSHGSNTKAIRMTNSEKAFGPFRKAPAKNIAQLQEKLMPYETRLEKVGYGRAFLEERNAFFASIPVEYMTNEPTDVSFILGFRAQLDHFAAERKARLAESKESDDQ